MESLRRKSVFEMSRNVYPEMLLKQKELLNQKGYDFDIFQSKSVLERYNILYDLQEEYLGHDKPINHIRPIVSVCIPTYQHHNYIKECIEGALMQQTSFPFEIVIGDDGSVDGTAEICMEYAKKYPDKIRFYNRTRELCRVFNIEGYVEVEQAGNWWWTLQDGRGTYIAICEGDDYWTDPLKLQKQVDILEANSQIGFVYTSFRLISSLGNYIPNSKLVKMQLSRSKTGRLLPYLLRNNFPQTLTVMFRKELKNGLNDYYIRSYDWPLFIHICGKCKAVFLKDITGCYRINPNGEMASGVLKTFDDKGFSTLSGAFRAYLAGEYNAGSLFGKLKQDLYMYYRISKGDVADSLELNSLVKSRLLYQLMKRILPILNLLYKK